MVATGRDTVTDTDKVTVARTVADTDNNSTAHHPTDTVVPAMAMDTVLRVTVATDINSNDNSTAHTVPGAALHLRIIPMICHLVATVAPTVTDTELATVAMVREVMVSSMERRLVPFVRADREQRSDDQRSINQ